MEIKCPDCGQQSPIYMDGDYEVFYTRCCDAPTDITVEEVKDFWFEQP